MIKKCSSFWLSLSLALQHTYTRWLYPIRCSVFSAPIDCHSDRIKIICNPLPFALRFNANSEPNEGKKGRMKEWAKKSSQLHLKWFKCAITAQRHIIRFSQRKYKILAIPIQYPECFMMALKKIVATTKPSLSIEQFPLHENVISNVQPDEANRFKMPFHRSWNVKQKRQFHCRKLGKS